MTTALRSAPGELDTLDAVNEHSGRTSLLKATITVVARGGLRSLTYRAVAAEAGVSHGLVRYHFGTRDQLIAESLDYSIDRSLRASNMHAQVLTPHDFADGLETLASREGDIHAFQYELLLESRRRPELAPHVERYYEQYRQAIARQLGRLGVTEPAMADAVWFALDGIVFKQLVAPGDVGPALNYVRGLVEVAAQP